MTAPAKPFPLQLASISFGEEPYYRLLKGLLGEGVVGLNDLKVSQKAGGANMSVDVAAGELAIRMTNPEGGLRFGYLAGVSNSGTPGAPNVADGWISTFTAADGANPRIDRVVATVYDSALDLSGRYEVGFRVIAGAPTAGATLANLSGAAAVPDNSILLANVLVPAGSSTIPDANIDSTLSRVRQHAITGGGLARGGIAPIASGEALASAASFDFQNIPADFAHLLLAVHARSDRAAFVDTIALRFNNDSGGNYDAQFGQHSAATTSAGEALAASYINSGQMPAASSPAGHFGAQFILIPNYAQASTHKSVVAISFSPSNTATTGLVLTVNGGIWRSAAAINRLQLLGIPGPNLVAGSRATLYGMAA